VLGIPERSALPRCVRSIRWIRLDRWVVTGSWGVSVRWCCGQVAATSTPMTHQAGARPERPGQHLSIADRRDREQSAVAEGDCSVLAPALFWITARVTAPGLASAKRRWPPDAVSSCRHESQRAELSARTTAAWHVLRAADFYERATGFADSTAEACCAARRSSSSAAYPGCLA
jgi:hypothetical protein